MAPNWDTKKAPMPHIIKFMPLITDNKFEENEGNKLRNLMAEYKKAKGYE
jgi:hypothetical protein